MKILRISLRNIASLAGTHTVDFTREPLRSAGLYSISGPTGAGKSSLLDALCLALFDDTPRLGAVGKLARLDDGDITQNDPRNLLRRGTAEGFAEVAFTGVDGADYTARWSVRRSRNKTDGKVQNSEMALYRGDIPAGAGGEIEQGGKKTEVLSAIVNKLGLTFGQFTRAVLLAQNDFAAFLKADDRTRAEILQALTATERFEAISIAVFTRCRDEELAVREIEVLLTGSPPLDAEKRAAAETELAAATAARVSAEAALEERRQQRKWFDDLAVREKALGEAKSGLEIAIKAREDAAPRRVLLARIEEALHQAAPLLNAERAEQTAAGDAVNKLHEARTRSHNCQASLLTAREVKTNTEKSFADARRKLDDARPLLQKARALDSTLAPLADRLKQAKSETSSAMEACRKLEQEHRKLAPDFNIASLPAEPDLRQAAADAKAALELAGTTAAQHDGERIAAGRRSLAAARTALGSLRDQLREWHRLTEQCKSAEDEIAGLEKANLTDTRAAAELNAQQIPAADQSLAAAREAHVRAAAAVEDACVRLRETLHPGEPCPVCGATNHPFSAHPPSADAAALRALRDNIVEKENSCRELRARLAGLESGIRSREDRIAGSRKLLAKSREQQEALAAVRHDHAGCRAVRALPEASRLAATEEKLAALDAESRQLETADAAHRAAEKHLARCRREYEIAVSALNVAEARAALKRRQADEGEAAAGHSEILRQRTELFAGRPADEVEKELTGTVTAGERQLLAVTEKLHSAENETAAAVEAVKAAAAQQEAAQKRHADAAAALNEWLAGFSSRHGAPLDRAGLAVLLTHDTAWCADERVVLENLDRAVQNAAGECQAHQSSLAAHQAARPAPGDEAAVLAALEKWTAELATAAARCDEARAIVTADDQRRRDNEALAGELAARRVKAEPWQKLNELIGSADGAKLRSLAQQRTLEVLLGYANAQLDHLTPRYRLERVPDSLNLIVLDRDMGDERRSVHSLSGGESFLVSLALALGLAPPTSNHLRIESLFIDEGFGSLDAETLNTAMGALMQLEAQGRKVGVISHVAEMADAIPVQIRVVKGRSGAARLEVPGLETAGAPD